MGVTRRQNVRRHLGGCSWGYSGGQGRPFGRLGLAGGVLIRKKQSLVAGRAAEGQGLLDATAMEQRGQVYLAPEWSQSPVNLIWSSSHRAEWKSARQAGFREKVPRGDSVASCPVTLRLWSPLAPAVSTKTGERLRPSRSLCASACSLRGKVLSG